MDFSTKRNRGGRPKKPERERRTRIIQTKLNEAEYESVRRRAEKKGVSVYDFARMKILCGCCSDNRITPAEWTLIKQFNKICNDLICIYHLGNCTDEFSKTIESIMFLKDTLLEKLKWKNARNNNKRGRLL